MAEKNKNAISDERESAGQILQKFFHVIHINIKLCKWILPCNLLKNMIHAAVPYVGIVYGCDILNGLVSGNSRQEIMDVVYRLVFATFALTLLFHILDKMGNAMRDSIRYRIQKDVAKKRSAWTIRIWRSRRQCRF